MFGEFDVTDRILEAAGQDPVVPDDPDDEESILDAVGTAIGNFVDWITGRSSSDPDSGSSGGGTASLSNLTVPITWSTTTSYRSGSDTGNNIGFDCTADDFYVKMSRGTSKMIIRNTDGELAEFGSNIRFYTSVLPNANIRFNLGQSSLKWANIHANYLYGYLSLRLRSGGFSDGFASNGDMWLQGSTVKVKTGGVVKELDDIGGVADISASWSSLSDDMIPVTTGDYDIGSLQKRWDNIYAGDIITQDIDVSRNADLGSVNADSLTVSGGTNLDAITGSSISITGTVSVSGTLDHDGSKVGFFGVTPATRQIKTSSSVATINAYDVTGATGNALLALATNIDHLVSVLQAYGLMTA